MLLQAVSLAALEKITVSGVNNTLNFCVIFLLYTKFTNVVAGRVGDPWSKMPNFKRIWPKVEASMISYKRTDGRT